MELCSCGKCTNALKKEAEPKRDDKFNNTLINLEANAIANPFVYLVCFVDLDGYCVKKSEITQVGIFSNKDTALDIAEKVRDENDGWSDDSRCNYVYVMEVKVDGKPCLSYSGEDIGKTIYWK